MKNVMLSRRAIVALALGAAALSLTTTPARAEEPYLLVSTDSSIWKFDLAGNSLGRLVEANAPGLEQPQHMAVDDNGNLYVVNWRGGIEVFSLADGSHLRTVNTGAELANGAHVVIRDNRLIVGSFGTDRILQYDLSDNDRLLDDFISSGGRNFQDPHGITWLENGEMLIAFRNQVGRYSADGQFLETFNNTGIVQGTDMEILGSDLLVSNFNGPTQRYDLATGASLGIFNEDGRGSGGDGIHVMTDNSVLLAFNQSQSIRWYDEAGNFLGLFANRMELEQERPNGLLLIPSPGGLAVLTLGGVWCTRRRRP